MHVFHTELGKHLVSALEQDVHQAASHAIPDDGFAGMTVGMTTITDREEAGKAILSACKNAGSGRSVKVGSYRGFSVSVQYDPIVNRFQLTLHGATTHRMDVGNDAKGNITRMDNLIAQIPASLEKAQAQLETTRQQMVAAKEELGKPFPQEEEFRTKSARLAFADCLDERENVVLDIG